MNDAPGAPQATVGGKTRVRAIGFGALALLGFVAIWFFAIRDRAPKDDSARIQGEWKITRPGEEAENDGPQSIVRIEGDRWTYISGGRETSAWRVTLNPGAKEIDLTRLEADGQPARFTYGARKGAEVKQLGVYSLDSETFKLTLAPVLEGRPTSLDGDLPSLTLTRVGK